MMRRRRNESNPGSGVADLSDPRVNFLARQLTALARFGALRHFNLQFFGLHQVLAGHAKADGSYFLVGTILGISIRKIDVPLGIFTAFAVIALPPDPSHCATQA